MVNNYFWKTSLLPLGMTFALIGLNGCSLSSSNENPSLHLDLSSLQERRFSLLNGGGFINSLIGTPPAAATGFACYGVNVTGPGIMDSSQHVERDPMIVFEQLLNVPNTYCSYRGVVTPPIQLSGTGTSEVALQVPPGGVRLVQLVGVNDSAVCASGVFGGNDSGGGSGKYFEIGRGVVYDLFGDRSIEVTTNWPSGNTSAAQLARAARTLDCGGNCSNIYDYTSSTTAANFSISNTTFKYAQKIPTVPGNYIRKARFFFEAPSGSVNATVTVYTSALNAAPTVATNFSASATITGGAAQAWADFDFYNSSFGYLQMQTGTDYWAVINSTNASGGSVLDIAHGYNATPGADDSAVQIYTSGWTGSSGQTDGIYSQVYGCGQ